MKIANYAVILSMFVSGAAYLAHPVQRPVDKLSWLKCGKEWCKVSQLESMKKPLGYYCWVPASYVVWINHEGKKLPVRSGHSNSMCEDAGKVYKKYGSNAPEYFITWTESDFDYKRDGMPE